MLSVNASLQTGLQLILAASATNDSTSGSSIGNSGGSSTLKSGTAATVTSTASSTAQGSSGSANSADGYSSASTVAALKAIQSTASGPEAGVMAAVVNSLSNSNDFYGNYAEAGNAAAQANENLSSKQVSDILLGGGSLVEGITPTVGGGTGFDTVSLNDIVNNLSDTITAEKSNDAVLSQWVADGMPSSQVEYGHSALANMTPDQIMQIVTQNEADISNLETEYNGITTAMKNGNLTIQKATDVQGLNYVDAVAQDTESADKNGMVVGWASGGGYNGEYLDKNASTGYLTSIDGVGVYLSW
ncbi:MAG: hypothetical protein WB816_14310 [Methylocystis sp.]